MERAARSAATTHGRAASEQAAANAFTNIYGDSLAQHRCSREPWFEAMRSFERRSPRRGGAMRAFESIQIHIRHGDPLVAAGLAATLREQPDFALAAPCAPGRSPCGEVGFSTGDVIVTDYDDGLSLIVDARAGNPGGGHPSIPNVLIVTGRKGLQDIRRALESGARGYLVVGFRLDELVDGVRALHFGMRHVGTIAARRLADSVACDVLTARETDVLRLIAEGHRNKVIARQLDISVGTVKSHLKAIFQKLDATNRTEVAAVAERRGLLDFDDDDVGGSAAPRSLAAQAFARHALSLRAGDVALESA
jgi:DNA-binding NarL/FixJ family response regulator